MKTTNFIVFIFILFCTTMSSAETKVSVQGINPNKIHEKIKSEKISISPTKKTSSKIISTPLESLSTAQELYLIAFNFSCLWAFAALFYIMANFTPGRILLKILTITLPQIITVSLGSYLNLPLIRYVTPLHWSTYATLAGIILIPILILKHFNANKHLLRE